MTMTMIKLCCRTDKWFKVSHLHFLKINETEIPYEIVTKSFPCFAFKGNQREHSVAETISSMAYGSVNIAKTSDEIETALDIENERKLHHGNVTSMQINIAVIGQPKSGKSSVINYLTNVSSSDVGAAEVDDTVTNDRVRKYDHSEHPNITFWELPGQKIGGAEKNADFDFDRYDFFLILSEKSFMESDDWYIKEVLQKGKPCFYLRTCIRRSVDGTKLAILRKSKTETLQEIRESCQRNLQTHGVTNPTIFLVDSDASFDNFFEFEDLKDQLLPVVESAKIGDIPFSFDLKHTEEMMKFKKGILEKRIREKGLRASKARTFNDRKEILKQEILFQQKLFEMDKSSLAKYKTDYDLPRNMLENFTIEFDNSELEENVIRFDKVDESRLAGSVSGYFRRASDFFVGVRRGKMATSICKQCIKILQESLQMVFSRRENLNKEVLSHLVTEKRKERTIYK